jgi:hypothetical protein
LAAGYWLNIEQGAGGLEHGVQGSLILAFGFSKYLTQNTKHQTSTLNPEPITFIDNSAQT